MNPHKVISLLVVYAPAMLAQYFRPDCCIGATRVACGVLGRIGLPVYPQPTRLFVCTMSLWRRLKEFDGTFREDEWSVGVGFGEDKRKADPNWKGYDGHLVAISQGRLIDLSFGQASRPQKGMELPDAVAVSNIEFPVRGVVNGCVVSYEKHDNPKFTESPDWWDTERTEPLIKQLVRTITRV
jgi:hypothetical protein